MSATKGSSRAECGIYLIENTESPLFYVGQSVDIAARWYSHRYLLNGEKKPGKGNIRLRNSWKKHGPQAFRFTVLELCDADVLTVRETFWLEHFRRLHPDCIANAVGPVDNPMRGKKHTAAALAKISAAGKGVQKSAEHRAKIGAAHKGRVMRPESRERLSATRIERQCGGWAPGAENPSKRPEFRAAMSGDNNPAKRPEVRAKMSATRAHWVVDIDSLDTWRTMSDCAASLGISVAAVSAALKHSYRCAGRILCRGT